VSFVRATGAYRKICPRFWLGARRQREGATARCDEARPRCGSYATCCRRRLDTMRQGQPLPAWHDRKGGACRRHFPAELCKSGM